MKKYLLPAIGLLILFIGAVVTVMYLSFEKNQYDKDMYVHISSLEENNGITAEYSGTKTQVEGRNIELVSSNLTRSARSKLFLKPNYDTDNTIVIEFPDGATYMVAEDTKVDDGVFVHYEYKKKSLWYSVKDLKVFDWLSRAISPEGVYNENTIVE